MDEWLKRAAASRAERIVSLSATRSSLRILRRILLAWASLPPFSTKPARPSRRERHVNFSDHNSTSGSQLGHVNFSDTKLTSRTASGAPAAGPSVSANGSNGSSSRCPEAGRSSTEAGPSFRPEAGPSVSAGNGSNGNGPVSAPLPQSAGVRPGRSRDLPRPRDLPRASEDARGTPPREIHPPRETHGRDDDRETQPRQIPASSEREDDRETQPRAAHPRRDTHPEREMAPGRGNGPPFAGWEEDPRETHPTREIHPREIHPERETRPTREIHPERETRPTREIHPHEVRARAGREDDRETHPREMAPGREDDAPTGGWAEHPREIHPTREIHPPREMHPRVGGSVGREDAAASGGWEEERAAVLARWGPRTVHPSSSDGPTSGPRAGQQRPPSINGAPPSAPLGKRAARVERWGGEKRAGAVEFLEERPASGYDRPAAGLDRPASGHRDALSLEPLPVGKRAAAPLGQRFEENCAGEGEFSEASERVRHTSTRHQHATPGQQHFSTAAPVEKRAAPVGGRGGGGRAAVLEKRAAAPVETRREIHPREISAGEGGRRGAHRPRAGVGEFSEERIAALLEGVTGGRGSVSGGWEEREERRVSLTGGGGAFAGPAEGLGENRVPAEGLGETRAAPLGEGLEDARAGRVERLEEERAPMERCNTARLSPMGAAREEEETRGVEDTRAAPVERLGEKHAAPEEGWENDPKRHAELH
ncbi:hypothetical protein T484DRAFT_1786489 [Baffinella frigidus]|nr:hypothetical protein T484DRAFT_1786489 [Cryptophyta sp. CCMP2293]